MQAWAQHVRWLCSKHTFMVTKKYALKIRWLISKATFLGWWFFNVYTYYYVQVLGKFLLLKVNKNRGACAGIDRRRNKKQPVLIGESQTSQRHDIIIIMASIYNIWCCNSLCSSTPLSEGTIATSTTMAALAVAVGRGGLATNRGSEADHGAVCCKAILRWVCQAECWICNVMHLYNWALQSPVGTMVYWGHWCNQVPIW